MEAMEEECWRHHGHEDTKRRLLSKDLSFLCTKWSNVRQQLLFGTNPHCNYRHENWLLTFIRITPTIIRDSHKVGDRIGDEFFEEEDMEASLRSLVGAAPAAEKW